MKKVNFPSPFAVCSLLLNFSFRKELNVTAFFTLAFLMNLSFQSSIAQTAKLQVGKEYEILQPMLIGTWTNYTCEGGWCLCSGSVVKIHLMDWEDEKYVVKVVNGNCSNCSAPKKPNSDYPDDLYCINISKLESNVRALTTEQANKRRKEIRDNRIYQGSSAPEQTSPSRNSHSQQGDSPVKSEQPEVSKTTFKHYVRADQIKSKDGIIYGNWSQSFAGACEIIYVSELKEGSIVSKQYIGQCDSTNPSPGKGVWMYEHY